MQVGPRLTAAAAGAPSGHQAGSPGYRLTVVKLNFLKLYISRKIPKILPT